MNEKFKKSIFIIVLIITPFVLWLGVEFLLNQITDRFEPLKVNKQNKSLYLNQDYFNDFFLYHLPTFLTTSASNRAIHLEKKDRIRIFCLGGSTTAGYPYNTFPQYKCPASFPNYLRAILQYNKNIPELDVLNVGCNALNSFNILQVFKDLTKYDPDIVIVYTGHNEFFGPNEFALPKEKALLYYNQKFSGLLYHLRRTYLYQGLRGLIHLFAKKSEAGHQDYLTWSKQNYVTYDDPINEIVKKNFEKNLTELARIARGKNIRVILCTPVSNWTFPPFISKHSRDLLPQEQSLWDSLYVQAQKYYAEEKYEESLNSWNKLKNIDSTYADVYYQMGKAYTKLAQYDHASYELWKAKDYDALPFRARSFISPIVRKVATNEGLPLVDEEQFFIQMSGQFIPHVGLLLEHLHPNAAGYYYLAYFMAQIMVKNHFFKGVTEIQYPEIKKCDEVLNILDFVVDKVEFDLANESYLERLSDLNPEIKPFLARIRQRAYDHAQQVGQEIAKEMAKDKSEQEKKQ